MDFMKFLILYIYLLISMNTIAQDFSKHKWENRLIIIFTENLDNSFYQKQVKELTKNEDGLLERKILVYHIFPGKYKIGLMTKDKWEKNAKNKMSDVPFEISLVGLDGGVKLSQSQPLTTKELFSIIDKMPMRRDERERKKE